MNAQGPDPNSNIPANPYTRRWTAERPALDAPPGQNRAQRTRGGLGSIAVVLGVLALKFKTFLLALFKFKFGLAILLKVLISGGSLLTSIWFYALFWGWKFAVILVLLLLAHEMGHYVAIRNYGMPASLPFFIPGFGAFTNMGKAPANAEQEAYIALAGPLTGALSSLVCYAFAILYRDNFWMAAAYLGCFINLINLFPILPFDGGRVAGAISPRIWIVGLALFAVAAVWFGMPIWLFVILILFGLPRMLAALRGQTDAQYFTLSGFQRLKIGAWYGAVTALLLVGMVISRVSVPGHSV